MPIRGQKFVAANGESRHSHAGQRSINWSKNSKAVGKTASVTGITGVCDDVSAVVGLHGCRLHEIPETERERSKSKRTIDT